MCIQLPVTERPESPAKSEAGEDATSHPATPVDDAHSIPSKSGTPSGKKKKESTEDLNGEQEEPAKARLDS